MADSAPRGGTHGDRTFAKGLGYGRERVFADRVDDRYHSKAESDPGRQRIQPEGPAERTLQPTGDYHQAEESHNDARNACKNLDAWLNGFTRPGGRKFRGEQSGCHGQRNRNQNGNDGYLYRADEKRKQ